MDALCSEIVFCAFRYCLGCTTYVVNFCCDYLVNHWDELLPVDRTLIVTEIKGAIARGRAGHEYDVVQWQRVLDRAKQEAANG